MLTDMEQSSLKLIEDNIALNGLSKARAQYMKWGEHQESEPSGTFDLVVGTDVIYSQRVLEPLAQTIARELKFGNGRALICNNSIRYDKFSV